MIAKSSPPMGEGSYMNKKPKALGGGAKSKGEGLYMNKKPKALDGGANVFNYGKMKEEDRMW